MRAERFWPRLSNARFDVAARKQRVKSTGGTPLTSVSAFIRLETISVGS